MAPIATATRRPFLEPFSGGGSPVVVPMVPGAPHVEVGVDVVDAPQVAAGAVLDDAPQVGADT
ncbi:MAG TPA: hypothetical protein VJ804_05265, partial [Acidimicrobiales bacterium]|nr:hypothetical protein [Acidimicrobiales bacterium]